MKPYYEEAGIMIYHGDCREILPSTPACDLVLTDPPYGVEYQSNHRTDRFLPIEGDSDLAWLGATWRMIYEVQRPDSWCISFYGWPTVDLWFGAWKRAGYEARSHLVCVKNMFGFGFATRAQHEPAYLLAKGKPKNPTPAPSDVFGWTRVGDPEHSTEKPADTIMALMQPYSTVGDLVLDPFCGSGTTLRAAKDLGRRAIGIEIEERYCEISANRLRQSVMNFGASA